MKSTQNPIFEKTFENCVRHYDFKILNLNDFSLAHAGCEGYFSKN